MTTLTKEQFVRRHRNDTFDVDDVRGRAAKRADLNGDGVIEGTKELRKLFDAIDAVDRNGSDNSINLGTSKRPTPARAALQNVERAATPRRGLSSGANREMANETRAQPQAQAIRAREQPTRGGREGVAQIERVVRRGRAQMVEGTITVNGNSYKFTSGGSGNGSLPPGTYAVTRHRDRRSDNAGMVVGGEGYSFALSDKFDSRVGKKRGLLRIHPDGRGPGTAGCIGIVGDASVQRAFRSDMLLALRQNGNRYQLRVEQ